jgi:hypothetical protein
VFSFLDSFATQQREIFKAWGGWGVGGPTSWIPDFLASQRKFSTIIGQKVISRIFRCVADAIRSIEFFSAMFWLKSTEPRLFAWWQGSGAVKWWKSLGNFPRIPSVMFSSQGNTANNGHSLYTHLHTRTLHSPLHTPPQSHTHSHSLSTLSRKAHRLRSHFTQSHCTHTHTPHIHTYPEFSASGVRF